MFHEAKFLFDNLDFSNLLDNLGAQTYIFNYPILDYW